jgi:hypothetical protein
MILRGRNMEPFVAWSDRVATDYYREVPRNPCQEAPRLA